jgi:hypothetical protein
VYSIHGESSLDDCSAQVFPYNIFAYCSICRVDCKFARNKKKISSQLCRTLCLPFFLLSGLSILATSVMFWYL